MWMTWALVAGTGSRAPWTVERAAGASRQLAVARVCAEHGHTPLLLRQAWSGRIVCALWCTRAWLFVRRTLLMSGCVASWRLWLGQRHLQVVLSWRRAHSRVIPVDIMLWPPGVLKCMRVLCRKGRGVWRVQDMGLGCGCCVLWVLQAADGCHACCWLHSSQRDTCACAVYSMVVPDAVLLSDPPRRCVRMVACSGRVCVERRDDSDC